MCALALPAQSSYIYGRILDPSATGAAGVAVSVVNEDNGFRYSSVSQEDGAYSAGPLMAGSYKITVRKEGFRSMIRFHVRVDGTRPERADFALSLGSVQETITVEDTHSIVARADDVSVLTQLARNEIDQLLLDGRGLLGLVEMSPGTTVIPATRGDAGQFVTDGQRPNTNYFTVDGISANHGVSAGGLPAQTTGGSLPVLSAFGSLDSLIPTGSVEQFEIRTSSSTAQFGRLPGAAVSVISRSGSDEFHGSAGYTFRNELLDANDWFANRTGDARAATRENNVDGSLGGPFWRNHTFFFISLEHIGLLEPFTWIEPVPSLTARATAPAWAQPALALFPVPNGPALGGGLADWQGINSRPGSLDAGSFRIDHSVNSRVSLFARFSDSPSANQFGITQVNHLYFRSWSGTAGLNWRISPELILDIRMNRSDTKAESLWRGATGCELLPVARVLQPAAPSCGELIRFDINGVADVVSGNEGNRWQHQWQTTQSLSWKRGAHSFQTGADFLRIEPVRSDANGTLSLIADSMAALDNSTNGYWRGLSPPVNQTTLVDEFSAWVHDTWRPLPHLTLVAGLRWEYSPPPPIGSTAPSFLDLVSGIVEPATSPRALWLPPYGHFAPRFGISYSPGKTGRTVIRAGAGLYYDSSLSIATDLINGGPLSLDQMTSPRNGLFSTALSYGFMPNLQLPRVEQWNVSLERRLTAADQISLGYIGSHGYDLIRREVGGLGSSITNWEALTTNNGYSHYNALIMQYRRHVANGVEALVSYAWSHSFDNISSDSFLVWAGSGMTPAGDYASSDYDMRHSLTASFNWALPGFVNGRVKSWTKGWSLDGMLRARSGFPITVLDTQQYAGISFTNAFRPSLVPDVPLWISDPNAAGGKSLNPQAFVRQNGDAPGNLGRNAIVGFGMWQLDLALRREFRLGDRGKVEFRIEAFNALNHPNFADPVRYLDSPYFGESTSMLNLMLGSGSPASGLTPMLQNGGPRSLEGVIRLRF
jgi:hypothetical protein